METHNGEISKVSFNINATSLQVVGNLDIQKIAQLTGVLLPTDVVQMHPGALKHVKREHPGVLEAYGHLIPDMISNPDYVGKNPKVPDSIELIKVVADHLLLAIKLDPSGYVYVSSFYALDNGVVKLQKRLSSGRLQRF